MFIKRYIFNFCFIILIFISSSKAFAISSYEESDVDLELVIAVDVSFSINSDEQEIQRRGYHKAFSDPEVISTILSGYHGKIAVTYVEWAGETYQKQIIPWMVIKDPKSAMHFAELLKNAQITRRDSTSISSALINAYNLIETNEFKGTRKVIDISGDGPNNDGVPVIQARDVIIAKGITINAIPLPVKVPFDFSMNDYFTHCVIGGPFAFSLPVSSWRDFQKTIKRKLILEISHMPFTQEPTAQLVNFKKETKINCLIGEELDRKDYNDALDSLTGGKSERWRLPKKE